MFKEPEDFIVEELPLYEPSQLGTHTFFAIRKRNLTTLAAITESHATYKCKVGSSVMRG